MINLQWFEVLDGLLGKHWRNIGLLFNCTFLLFGSVIQLIACASNIYYINDNLDKKDMAIYIWGMLRNNCVHPFFPQQRREIMHAMWKPQKFKLIYLMATLCVDPDSTLSLSCLLGLWGLAPHSCQCPLPPPKN